MVLSERNQNSIENHKGTLVDGLVDRDLCSIAQLYVISRNDLWSEGDRAIVLEDSQPMDEEPTQQQKHLLTKLQSPVAQLNI